MAYQVLDAKLCELGDSLTRLSSRIHLSETASHHQLRQEIGDLSRECAQMEGALQSRLLHSRAEAVATLAGAYGKIERILQKTETDWEQQAAGQADEDAAAEEKILLAEYALDFALQAANRALLIALKAIDAQYTGRKGETETQ